MGSMGGEVTMTAPMLSPMIAILLIPPFSKAPFS